MAVGIVIGLEVVDICDDEGQRFLTPSPPLPFPDQGLIKEAAVGQVGEAVPGGVLPLAFIGILQLLLDGFQFHCLVFQFLGFFFQQLAFFYKL